MSTSINFNDNLIAHYMFDDESTPGSDLSGNGNDAISSGVIRPHVKTVNGRKAAVLTGGPDSTSYFKLSPDVLSRISDDTGLTICGWLCLDKGPHNMWERIIDFGSTGGSENLFITCNMRCVVVCGEDIVTSPVKPVPRGEWFYFAYIMTGSKNGTAGKAGGTLYINGSLAGDGRISQTSSGKYAKLRRWFDSLKDTANYPNCYIGRSMYEADPNLSAALSDFRIYNTALSHDNIIELMCSTLTDREIVTLAAEKYLTFPPAIITKDVVLPTSLMDERVEVSWSTDNPNALSGDGKIGCITAANSVVLTASLKRNDVRISRSSSHTVLPSSIAPYTLNINGNDSVLDVSETLWGLFYEDINNAADGGIYAELIQNRSFEHFYFRSYNHLSGENGVSGGRVYEPLFAWFGDTDLMTPLTDGSLNEYFGLKDGDVNSHYVVVKDGAVIYNRGFHDNNNMCSIRVKKDENYIFTIWAKTEEKSSISIVLTDENGTEVSSAATVEIEGITWNKYGVDRKIMLTGNFDANAQLKMTFNGTTAIDMVSLFPENVWGKDEETSSSSAHANYLGNPNYRLRRDMVEALIDLHPTFLRFPGGCISEGSYTWDNVYDWKDSVDIVELRKENYNVWGYCMTMGLGYMEYFQLAEDLNAYPLPVMACGVLCQARSDYANPAGGKLREKYIKNFTDLIDFALSTDFDNNVWAALRKKMGHPSPFKLNYLGIGNENWGPEFMANFEIFYEAITKYAKENYPGHELNIISTVGAQADDDSYQDGWKFLSGNYTGSEDIAFSDGVTSAVENVSWYKYQNDFMETIADEHYYRSNNYLLNNADRYNYYYRAYNPDGSIDNMRSSKVFVGEYASSEKNTLTGAVAEAAVMTGFENNSDVVRLAATAPLFNKVLTDSQYRWTPDCIWFDNETLWHTPTYYVQQLFAKYVGKKLLSTSFSTYEDGAEFNLVPRGGIEIATCNAKILVKKVTVTSNVTGSIMFESNFVNGLPEGFVILDGDGNVTFDGNGMCIDALNTSTLTGIACIRKDWSNYRVDVTAVKLHGKNAFFIGSGVTCLAPRKSATEYVIGYDGNHSGVKVYKNGIEGYTLGDFASGIFAGNLRSSITDTVEPNTTYNISLDFGSSTGKNLICSFAGKGYVGTTLSYKLEAYNNYIYNSVTADEENIYVKLVNADSYIKSTNITVNDADIETTASTVTITADLEYAMIPNVNTRDNEIVVPTSDTISFYNNRTVINLPANSVTCIIIKKK